MSRGPGRLQRQIAELFKRYPDEAFTIRELAEHLYGPVLFDDFDTQRVALWRALSTIDLHYPHIDRLGERAGTVYNALSAKSREQARLKNTTVYRQWEQEEQRKAEREALKKRQAKRRPMTEAEKKRDRVAKLLALARKNPNKHEAQAALRKAQAPCRQYGFPVPDA